MIQSIRTSKITKVLSSYLAIQLIIQMVQPTAMWALTGGPKQPEFNSFTPIGTSDMVSLTSGDFNYNIPVMDVGGYPLNLSYSSGVTMDQEASWVGLGWNLNVGQINRNVRGIPDDFKGDPMTYQNNVKDNVTVGVGIGLDLQIFGLEKGDGVDAESAVPPADDNPVKNPIGSFSPSVKINYNNYTGISVYPTFGLSFDVTDNVTAGLSLEGSASDGPSISPSVSIKSGLGDKNEQAYSGSLNMGIGYNSNRGLSDFSISTSVSRTDLREVEYENADGSVTEGKEGIDGTTKSAGTSGRVSFATPTMTPRKRNAYRDIAGTIAISTGLSAQGIDGEIEFSAMGSVQKIKDKEKVEKAYGYDFTGHASDEDIIDYNRENDQVISKSLKALPVTNYTYDTYSVQAQGVGGQFRPYRSQVGHIYDETVKDVSEDFSLGLEVEGGVGFHTGANFTGIKVESSTGVWNTKARGAFKQTREDLEEVFGYEPVYYKYVGENRIDKDLSMYEDQLGGDSPIELKISGPRFDKNAISQYSKKVYGTKTDSNGKTEEGVAIYEDIEPAFGNNSKIRRSSRDIRNQSIQKISRGEMSNFYTNEYLDAWRERNDHDDVDHHTSEIRVLKPDGSTYVFGETVYNLKKEETTFALPIGSDVEDCSTGQFTYNTSHNSMSNDEGRDHLFINTITPAYAHSYLLSSILSTDYEDLSGDGPTEDDLGSYTLFEYEKKDDFKWRVPFNKNSVTFNEGLNTDNKDEKGNYIYGEKEIKYIKQITTKTHVAFFDLSPRKDGWGVEDKNGGRGDSRMYQLDKIRLYSLPEAKASGMLTDEDEDGNFLNDEDDYVVSPIKTANFEYNHELCKGIDNYYDEDTQDGPSENFGKLTLERVYFTYRDSHMGRYTPYTFDYGEFNPDYNVKAYDIWGNYKPNDIERCDTQGDLTSPEFPFVDQEDEEGFDRYTSAWSLKSIGLPSGGKIDLEYESDDYQYVQDKDVLQMFKVAGVGYSSEPQTLDELEDVFYDYNDTGRDRNYLYVKLTERVNNVDDFKSKYLRGLEGKPIYFRFLMNMTTSGSGNSTKSDYDFVTGYFQLDENDDTELGFFSLTNDEGDDEQYVAIPTKQTEMEAGVSSGKQISPFSKAGLFFARRYLQQHALNLESNRTTTSVEAVANSIVSSIPSLSGFLEGPNQRLRGSNHNVAKKFVPKKSWIRLSVPRTNKLGGGLRVKRLAMYDNWDKLLTSNDTDGTNFGSEYGNQYGQTYDYTLDDGSTSGVATYEPNSSAENPLIEPFYNDANENENLSAEDLLAPRELNYVEKPFGASFFPSSTVTYSKVTVSNLEKDGVTKHATGKVVTEHFTSKDYPTKYDYTDMSPDFQTNENFLADFIKGIFGLPIFKESVFTLSQGFVIRTNDMNGKMKSQSVFAEESATSTTVSEPISTVEYKYSTKEDVPNELDNKLTVIHEDGLVETNQIGVDYDVVNDFRRSYSHSETLGLKGNVAVIAIPLPPLFLPIPSGFPTYVSAENIANSAITTKVIHTTAIQTEKIATDLGASVTTTNEAWDAQTGQVLLTKTINEYDDLYYNFNMPAYWNYKDMGLASNNLGIKGSLKKSGNYYRYTGSPSSIDTYFSLGDEIAATYNNRTRRMWVADMNSTGVALMDRLGNRIESSVNTLDFEIIRSGYRNQQLANMSSFTLMNNPLDNLIDVQGESGRLDTNSLNEDLQMVNASAVTYKDFWNCQCERGLKFVDMDPENPGTLKFSDVFDYKFNPYLFNVNGDWRADKSYAYLTERTNVNPEIDEASNLTNVRKEGFFKEFQPFYELNSNEWEQADDNSDKWTFASEVTQFNSYGPEVENVDALGRFSSAQYGYNYTLPTAVASNTQYRQMGADNMEDYNFDVLIDDVFTVGSFAPDLSDDYNNYEDHFNFRKADVRVNEVSVSDDFAHTGAKSLLILSGNEANMIRPLVEEFVEDTDTDGDGIDDVEDPCPFEYSKGIPDTSGYTDRDKDGVGDVCDDDSYVKFYNLVQSEENVRINNSCYGSRARFTLQGKPNTTVSYKIVSDDNGRTGWWSHVNGVAKANSRENTNEDVFDIELDATGQACVVFDVNAKDGESSGCCKWETKKNTPEVTFEIIHTTIDGLEVGNTLEVVTLEPVGLRDGCGKTPSSSLNCTSY